jgi:hypothetical protein
MRWAFCPVNCSKRWTMTSQYNSSISIKNAVRPVCSQAMSVDRHTVELADVPPPAWLGEVFPKWHILDLAAEGIAVGVCALIGADQGQPMIAIHDEGFAAVRGNTVEFVFATA